MKKQLISIFTAALLAASLSPSASALAADQIEGNGIALPSSINSEPLSEATYLEKVRTIYDAYMLAGEKYSDDIENVLDSPEETATLMNSYMDSYIETSFIPLLTAYTELNAPETFSEAQDKIKIGANASIRILKLSSALLDLIEFTDQNGDIDAVYSQAEEYMEEISKEFENQMLLEEGLHMLGIY